MTSKPVALIFAGPNGAGKTTVSSVFVGPDVEFVNADIIGAELRREDPPRPGADVTAGRICFGTAAGSDGRAEELLLRNEPRFTRTRRTDRRMACRRL